MTETVRDFLARQHQEQARRTVAGAGIILGSVREQNPDQVAGAIQTANTYSKMTGAPVAPASMAVQYKSLLDSKIADIRNTTTLSRAPRLAEWIRDPENAVLAQDDLEGLAWWDNAVGRGVQRGAMRAGPQAFNQYLANRNARLAADAEVSFGEMLSDARTPIMVDDKEVGREWAGPSAMFSAGMRWLDARTQVMEPDELRDTAAYRQERAGKIAGDISRLKFSETGEVGKALFSAAQQQEGWQNQLAAMGAAFRDNPLAMTSFITQVAAEVLPQLAATAGVAALTRNPKAAVATMAGGSFATEYGAEPVKFFQEKGIDVSTPEGAMKVVSDPALMREAESRGITRGVVIAALDAISGGVAGTKLARSAAGNVALQSLTQAIMGGTGEAAAQFAVGDDLNAAEILLEGLAEMVTAPLDVGNMAMTKFRERRGQAREAEGRVTVFQEISGQAVNSKLRARMPDKFRAYVEAVTANGPVENVFVPARDFVTYFQSQGIDPFALVDEFEGVTRDDLDAAIAGGGDLRIPTATYAAKIAGSEHDAFLMQNMRFDPLDMTAAEAADFNARIDEATAEMWQEAEEARLEDERWRPTESRIYDEMVSQLRAAGQSTEVGTTAAHLYPAFYKTWADRLGVDPEDLLKQYNLPKVVGSLPAGMQMRDVSEIDRTIAELRRRSAPKKKTPLLEFISARGGIDDVGGELASRNAAGSPRVGMKRLARKLSIDGKPIKDLKDPKSYGWDDVAQAAVENGFMADHPVVIEWKLAQERGDQVAPDIVPVLMAAIDEELSGSAQFSDQDLEGLAARRKEEQLDAVEDYLTSLGLTLDAEDAEIKAAILADQSASAGDRMYAQGGEVRSEPNLGSGPTAAMDAVIADLGGEVVSREYDSKGGFGDEAVIRVGDTDLQISIREDALGVYLTNIASKVAGVHHERRAGSGAGASAIRALKAYADKNGKPFAVVGSTEPARGFYEKMGMVAEDVTLFMDDGYLTATASGEGGGGFVYRPAGSAQIRTESDAFKRWFGDSKVVGPDGKPLVVYHGTNAEFEAFSKDADAKHIELPGFYFTPDAWVADGFSESASRKPFRDNDGYIVGFDGASVVPVYLSIQNPVEISLDDWDTGRMTRASDVRAMLEDAQRKGHDGAIIRGWSDGSGDAQYVAFRPEQIKSVFNRGTWDASDPRLLYQNGGHPFSGFTRDQFLGSPKITSDGNASTLKPNVLPAVADVVAVPFPAGDGLTARYHEYGAAVFDGDKVVASYNFGDTLVVDKKYRRKGIASELVYQWRIRNPNSAPAKHRTKKSQAVQEQVWDRIQREISGDATTSYNQGAYGAIELNTDGTSVIRLFEKANLSTFLHESGHFFLNVMQDLAAKGEQSAVTEVGNLKAWWSANAKAVAADANRANVSANVSVADVLNAVNSGTSGSAVKDAAIEVGMHEQFARGFEAYLMEGKAPSAELRDVFSKFRAWLIAVYRKIAGLNVNISDDLRGVFDRMLASDEQIEKAKAELGDRLTFKSADQLGMTQEEYDRYMKLRNAATEDAKTKLLVEALEPIKRQREQWYKDEREKVEAEVARQINANPGYRALEWMGNGRWLGDDKPIGLEDIRLSKSILVERYGDGVLKTLRRGKKTVYTVEGGVDPDDAADWFGFGSGDELVRALERMPDRKEAIKAETDKLMFERHGDVLNDGEIEGHALDAVQNDRRGQWIASELEAVRKIVGTGVGLTAKEARATAKTSIARMRVRDAMSAGRFLAAERKAANEAYQLVANLTREGYWETRAKFMAATPDGRFQPSEKQADMVARLFSSKRRQLMNHALYMESRSAIEEVSKAEGLVRKLSKAKHREKIAGAGRRENAQTDYLAAIDEILERYDFRKISGKAEERRGALVAFVEAMKASGRENMLAIPDSVLAEAKMKPYKSIPLEELRGVVDSLKNIEHIALRWNDLIDATNKRKFDEVVSDILGSFEKNVKKRPPGRVDSTGESARRGGRKFIDLVLNAGTMLREIDGFEELGAAYRNIKSPIDEAQSRLIARKEKAAKDFDDLYAVYSTKERRSMAVRRHVPELGRSYAKWDLISIALNTGNEGNLQRLSNGPQRYSFTKPQIDAILGMLDERDADFIQSVWDYVGSYWSDIVEREKRVSGVAPDRVEAVPVTIGGKLLKGGYYPLRYDPRLSSTSRDNDAQSVAESLQAGRYGKAQTKRGHLEARAKSTDQAVMIDIGTLHKHINQVMYDLELSEPVANSWKILQNGEIRDAFREAGRQPDFDALEVWLKDTAEGQLSAGDVVNNTARRLKSNFTAAKLAFNVGTVLVQVTGVAQTMVVVGKKDFLRGLQASLRVGVTEEILAKSAFMATRQTTYNKDISDFYDDPKLGQVAGRWGTFKRDVIGKAAFYPMTKVQWFLVDVPTWMAGYQQGLRKFGNDESKAVSHADAIVKRAQASGIFSDRSAIERGSVSSTHRQMDYLRLFTTLGSYMFAKFNVAYERSMKAGRVISDNGISLTSAKEALSWTIDVAFLFTLEAVFMAAIKGKLPDEDDEEEGWAGFLAKETAMSVLGSIPFVRDIASFTSGFESGGAYGGIISELGKPFLEAGQGEVDRGFAKSIVNATGLATGLPASQFNRALDAGWRLAEGDDVSPLEFLLGRMGK